MPGAFPGKIWRMPREKSPQVIPTASDAAVPALSLAFSLSHARPSVTSFPSHAVGVEWVQRPDSQGSAQKAYLNLQTL